MKAHHQNLDSINETNKRLFRLLFELHIELESQKTLIDTYPQELRSEIDKIKRDLEILMERMIKDE